MHRTTNTTDDTQWDETVDVIIIGSGFAGLAAAYEASKRVDSVLILEKMSYSGGNSRIAGGGYCCWDSKLKLREELGLGEDSWELHAKDTLAAGQGYNDPDLVEVLAKEAPDGLNLMVDAGIPFRKSLPRIGGHSAYRSYQIACNGAETMQKLEDYCLADEGAQLRRDARVIGLYRDGSDGRVVGVEVEQGKAGEQVTKNIHANVAVIIATGGYGNDVELRTAYKPSLTDAYSCTNHKGATGEVIRYARDIGADVLHMEFVQLYPCANPQNGGIDQAAFLCYSGTGYGLVYVDSKGERFVNELASREVVSTAQIESGAKPTYSILNDEIFEKLGVGADDVSSMVKSGRAVAADTLEDLADAMGFDRALFVSSIAEHNDAIAEQRDAAFNTPVTQQMVPLTKGKFYAIAQWPSVHYCMGGLRIDPDAHVLDIFGKPIPGLYAAGEVCGGLHGIDRLGGNGIAECMVFGLRAGQLK